MVIKYNQIHTYLDYREKKLISDVKTVICCSNLVVDHEIAMYYLLLLYFIHPSQADFRKVDGSREISGTS